MSHEFAFSSVCIVPCRGNRSPLVRACFDFFRSDFRRSRDLNFPSWDSSVPPYPLARTLTPAPAEDLQRLLICVFPRTCDRDRAALFLFFLDLEESMQTILGENFILRRPFLPPRAHLPIELPKSVLHPTGQPRRHLLPSSFFSFVFEPPKVV